MFGNVVASHGDLGSCGTSAKGVDDAVRVVNRRSASGWLSLMASTGPSMTRNLLLRVES